MLSLAFPPVAPANPTTPDTAGSGRDLGELILDFGDRGKRGVLPRLCLPENEPGVLLRKEALRDFVVHDAGDDDERERHDQHQQLMPKHPFQSAVVAFDHAVEEIFGPPADEIRPVRAFAREKQRAHHRRQASARRRPRPARPSSPSPRIRETAARQCPP